VDLGALVGRDVGGVGVKTRLGLRDGNTTGEEERRLRQGPYGGDTLRVNRPVAPGGYVLSRLRLERNRFVNPHSLQPGLGARLLLERAAGTLERRDGELHFIDVAR
jgi:hypothetical protein